MESMKVSAILERKGHHVETIGPADQFALALHRMTTLRIGALVVLDDERVAGVLSERDVVRGLARHGAEALTRRVRDLMALSPTCAPGEDVTAVMQRMTHGRHRHLPVVDRGRLCGIISIGDLVKFRLEELELETHVLRDVYLARA